jgi:hypothetical protein
VANTRLGAVSATFLLVTDELPVPTVNRPLLLKTAGPAT